MLKTFVWCVEYLHNGIKSVKIIWMCSYTIRLERMSESMKNSGQWKIRTRMTSSICHMKRIAATPNVCVRVFFVCLCVCVILYVFVCVYVCLYVCFCVHVCLSVCLCVWMCVFVCVCVFEFVFLCVFLCLFVCVCVADTVQCW